MHYARPQTLSEAVAALAGRDSLVLAGGTDIYPANVGRPLAGDVVDISGVSELRGISQSQSHIRIGGATTWSDIIRAALPPAFDALKAAAREVGSVQIQNRATIAGNLCNASPAADGVPPLLILDAEVELASTHGSRRLPLSSFITGNRRTERRGDEILAAVLVPKASVGNSAFLKLGARRYLVISIVMAAALLAIEQGRIVDARVALGSASAVALRLPQLENALRGHVLLQPPSSVVRSAHFSALSPIDDLRATASYRLDAAREIVSRVLDEAAGSNFRV